LSLFLLQQNNAKQRKTKQKNELGGESDRKTQAKKTRRKQKQRR